MLKKVVVGLGANLGDRAQALDYAVESILALDGARLLARSKAIETAPVGGPPDQPPFLNGAVAITWAHDARALLDALLTIEKSFGRVRDVRWGPRTIDLDILWIEGVVIDEPGLTVPHPRLQERQFALVPLLEVAPDARDPRTRVAYAEIAATGR